MGYARYIGHVGGLAVALGIGAAVTGLGGTAWADETLGATTNSESGQKAEAADAASTGGKAGPTARTDADPTATNTASTGLDGDAKDVPRVRVSSSGGAYSGTRQSNTPKAAPIKPPDTAAQDTPPEVLPSSVEQPNPAVVEPTTDQAAAASQTKGSHPQPKIAAQVQRADDGAAADTLATTTTKDLSKSIDSNGVNGSDPQLADTTGPVTQPAPKAPAAPTADPATQVVSGLTAAVGLNPNATDAPEPAPPTLLDVLTMIGREFLRTFFNQTPTMAYIPRENSLLADGSIVGNLHPMDGDSAVLTYTATDPAHGDVVVNPDGYFTYTPPRGLRRPRRV